MVLGKLKNMIAENKLKNNKRKATRLGFKTISEYKKWKEETRQEAHKKASEMNRKKLKDKMQKNIIYNRTTSPGNKMRDLGVKLKKGLDDFDKSMDEFDKAMNPGNKRKSGSRKKKSSQPRKKKNSLFPDFDF